MDVVPKNKISRQHEKCFDMIPNVSEAQVLTPSAHGEPAVRVSALRELIISAKSLLGIPSDPHQDRVAVADDTRAASSPWVVGVST